MRRLTSLPKPSLRLLSIQLVYIFIALRPEAIFDAVKPGQVEEASAQEMT